MQLEYIGTMLTPQGEIHQYYNPVTDEDIFSSIFLNLNSN